MRRAALALALSALALLPTAAIAAAPQPAVGPFDAPTVTAAMAAAETAWPDNPCVGQSVVRPITAQDAQQQYRVSNALGFATQNAWGAASDCGFWLVSDVLATYAPVDVCTVMVHELGHVLGHDHDDEPTSVMYRGGHSPNVQSPVCTAAFPSAVQSPSPQPAPPVAAPTPRADDTLEADFVPYAATPHLMAVQSQGRHRISLLLNNPNALGRVVVTFYRRGFILGCGRSGVCNPWDLSGRISSHSAALDAHAALPTVRTPRGWTIATVQIKEPRTRDGVIAAFTPSRVKHNTRALAGPCEFPPCA